MKVIKETKLKRSNVHGGSDGYEFLLTGTKDELESNEAVNFVIQQCTSKNFFPSKVYPITGALKTENPKVFKCVYRGLR